MSEKNYKEAKLYDCRGRVSTNDRWYFYFYILDPNTGLYKRYFERFNINRIKGKNNEDTKKKRYVYAKDIIPLINEWLENEGYKDSPKIQSEEKTLKSGIALALSYKFNKNLKQRSVQTYQNIGDRFCAFIEKEKKSNFLLSDVNKQTILSFRDYIIGNGGVGNYTANKNIGLLHSIFQELVEREFIKINPCASIKKLEETEGEKNTPFSADELEIIFKKLPERHERLWMFFLFIWYTMMRSAEICNITVSMIDFKGGYLNLPATISKTKKNRIVYLMPEFVAFLRAMGVDKLNPSDYIFSHRITLESGKKAVLRNRISEHWKTIVKDNLGIDKDMYAAKHTSAKIFMLNGGSKEALQSQMGHATVTTTEIYLKKILPQESLQRFAKEFPNGPLSTTSPSDFQK